MYPEIKFSSDVIIPTYFVYLSLLYTFILIWVNHRAATLKFDQKHTLNISLILMLGGFVGARLFHVYFESWDFYKEDLSRIYMFWEGGFVFYGGALLAAILAIIYLRFHELDVSKWLDFWAPVGALGYGLGRLSCFLQGCCFGSTCHLPWAVQGRHPTQLYATFWELGVFAILLLLPRLKKLASGQLFWMWLGMHSAGRLIMEHYREDFRGAMYFGFTISSLISLGLFALSLTFLAMSAKKIKMAR